VIGLVYLLTKDSTVTKIITAVASLPINRRSFIRTGAAFTSVLALPACGSGDDSPLLANKQAALEKQITEFMAKTGVPGAAVSLMNTRNSIQQVAGVRELGKSPKVVGGDSFHIGSNAKSMLAMLIMRSVELNELKLETPIYQLVPSLKSSGKSAYANVTLENLLSHRAGIETLLDVPSIEETLPVFSGTAVSQRRQTLEFLTSREPIGVPGASFNYSNGSYACAAAVLEAVAGKSYEQLLVDRLFVPLGLKGTVGWPAQANAAAPYGHLFLDGAFIPFEPNDPRAAFRPALTPAGNVSMNIFEYTRYLTAHLSALRGDEFKGLTKASYERLHRAIPGADFGYALGWATDGKDKQGKQLDYHYGSTDIFGCFALLQPSKNRAVAVMVNGEKPPFEEAISGLAYAILALLD
jgi:D-alanyl-D-alanine carboxypeptidase